MKKLFAVVVILLLASCTQTKIAYINVEDLMKDYEGTKALEETLKAKQEAKTKELDSLSAPFQAKVQQYYQNAQKMSAKKRAETEQVLNQENQLLQARQQKAGQELQEENQKLSDALTKKVDSFVEAYAKTQKLNLILGTSGNGTVMYGDEQMNITKEILEILNENFTKE